MAEPTARRGRPLAALERLLGELRPICDDLSSMAIPAPTAGAADEWAASGAMTLTGRRDGGALPVSGAPATAVAAALAVFDRAAASWATADGPVPGPQLLGERAALSGWTRRAPWSVGGAFRILPARDGWVGFSLPRASDYELLPALIETTVEQPWPDLARWLLHTPADAAVERAAVLGMAAAVVPEDVAPPRRPGVLVESGGSRPARGERRPRVLDLSSLWAGPLCTHLLAARGADVVKVESRARLDGARRGPVAFYDLLHHGQRCVVLDFAARRGRETLAALVRGADLVVEASRPRALRQLGIDAREVTAAGTSWLSVTGYGRAEGHRIGFGDDVAAGAGLVARLDGRPVPAGDALADPLTGVWAAAAAAAALGATQAHLLDVSMHDVARAAAQPVDSDTTTATPAPPRARGTSGVAAAPGTHTATVRGEPGDAAWPA